MSDDTPQRPTLQQEDARVGSTPAALRNRAVLERAKGRHRPLPGGLEGVPRFDEISEEDRTMKPAPGYDSAPQLSRETSEGLAALAAAQPPPAEPEEPEEEKPSPADLSDEEIMKRLGCDLDTAVRVAIALQNEDTVEARARKATEDRLAPLDIGQFIMNGVISQNVSVMPPSASLPKGLTVTFQSVTEGVEVMVDRRLANESASTRAYRTDTLGAKKDAAEMTEREYYRRQSEIALAVHISNYMGRSWVPITKKDGTIDDDAVAARLALVRDLPSPLFTLLLNNLRWFHERVQKAMDIAVLGNG